LARNNACYARKMAEETVIPEGGAPASSGAAVVAPAVTEAATGEPAPAPEASSPVPAPEPVAADPAAEPEPTALSGEPAPVAEPVAEATAKPAAEAVVEPPAPITYAEFKLPNGVTPPAEQMTAFTDLAAKSNLTQEAAQQMLDLYGAEATRYAAQVEQHQRDVWEETKSNWRGEIDKRFGNRRDTVVNDAKWAKSQLLTDDKSRAAFEQFLEVTGAGDHPEFVSFLAAAAKKMRERGAPPPGLSPRNQPSNPADRRYGSRPNS
jgi:hypothetical protein